MSAMLLGLIIGWPVGLVAGYVYGLTKRPRVKHARGCPCGGSYICAGCRREVGYCDGGSDDMPHHCDDCWAKAHARDVEAAS